MNRRETLMALGLVSLALAACAPAGQQDDTGNNAAAEAQEPTEVVYLFVQSAGETSLADGVLRLGGVSSATVFFSDRPERIAGHMETTDFVDNWGEGDDSFEAVPPNATVSILTGPMPQEIVVVLTNPRFEDDALVYDVEILEGADAATGDAASLFIDVVGRPLTPVSVAGVSRRTSRRTTRRVDRR